MFYFAHPFGISTPSSTATTTNIESTQQQPTKKSKKSTKYTTTTYLVTEIQKNIDESSQDDECCDQSKSSSMFHEHDMLPWPTSLLLPPPIIQQLIEQRKGERERETKRPARKRHDVADESPMKFASSSIWYRISIVSNKWKKREPRYLRRKGKPERKNRRRKATREWKSFT